jgi:hypothetical protein
MAAVARRDPLAVHHPLARRLAAFAVRACRLVWSTFGGRR